MAVSEGGPRARYREQTRGEIKEIALRQLAEGGISSVALTRIAKELGLSGPALYRYFGSRDDLLNALIRDAYDDAAQDIHAAADGAAGQSPRARLQSLAGAYRAWAVAHPHRYLLIAGTPLPDYTAPADTVQRARAVLGPFLAVFTHGEPTPAVLPLVRELRDWAQNEPEIAAWVAEWVAESRKPSDGDADAEGAAGDADTEGTAGDADDAGHALAGAVLAWSRMHGTVSLEVAGQFTGMGHAPRTLFEANVDTLADAFRLT
ncbi:TetR/AcrR family transcriptional regulator [Streptosporangium sp. 'caverna']|uniref:TetR/AcrR family transcriptional regulator n=1 Tax=Streptosporangium sp. 'caverna' TaxID=2202249 RepID=UPI0019551740|nr:TetR/AcrR family transcriptional regulator [Streptosporangium sp. 'caverna']